MFTCPTTRSNPVGFELTVEGETVVETVVVQETVVETVVERSLEFVLACVKDDGYITYAGSRMYSHAFATLFLAEIYGMTHRADVKSKLQLAVDFIVNSQNSEGGWRYEPYAAESDMSIVVCQSFHSSRTTAGRSGDSFQTWSNSSIRTNFAPRC